MRLDQSARTGLAADLADLRVVLARLPFPARQDDVLAARVCRRAPSRLLWRAGSLSRVRDYTSLDELCAELAAPRRPPA